MLIELTADVVAAYVSNNPVPAGDLPNLIADVHAALGRVGGAPRQPPADKQKPAVNPKRSVHDDYIICLEDGKKFKSLKRHLMTHYGLTPDQYREKWGLDASYPMVAPNYAAARSQLAKKMGLGPQAQGGKVGITALNYGSAAAPSGAVVICRRLAFGDASSRGPAVPAASVSQRLLQRDVPVEIVAPVPAHAALAARARSPAPGAGRSAARSVGGAASSCGEIEARRICSAAI